MHATLSGSLDCECRSRRGRVYAYTIRIAFQNMPLVGSKLNLNLAPEEPNHG